jgi:glycosyltransferase involved in cell wall biosynthesis
VKIIIIDTINNIPSHKQFQDLAVELKSKGFKILHLSDSKREDYFGVKVIYYNKQASLIKKLKFFYQIFDDFQPNLVISTFRANILVDFISYSLNFKWIATYQSAYYEKKLINKFRYRYLDKMIVLSTVMEKEIIKIFPHLTNKIKVIPNSFIFSDIKISSKKDIILHVGNSQKNNSLKYVKGTDVLVSSFNLLKKSGLSVELWIVGDYDEKFIKDNICQGVKFLGKKSHEDVLNLMSCSKILAQPSRNEAFGQVFIEAMQNACSLIGTYNTGAEDIIEVGKYGYLIPQDDSINLATALRDGFQNYNSPEDCLNEYKFKMEVFSRKSWVNNINNIIENQMIAKKNL